MGVTYSACIKCNEAYSDHCESFTCSTCDKEFCNEWCGGKVVADRRSVHSVQSGRTYYKEDTSCVMCRKEFVPDGDLMAFLLKQAKLTRESATAAYLASLVKDGT